MKKNIIPIILISSIMIVLIVNYVISNNQNKEQLAKNYSINSFDTSIVVNQDNTFSVKEKISVNWLKSEKEGFVRIVPTIDFFKFNDGKKYYRNLDIPTLHASDQSSKCESIINKQLRLSIESSTGTPHLGYYTYEIDYNGNFGNDPNKGFDEIVYHAFGDNCGNAIRNPSLSVTLPSKIDNMNIKFFADKNCTEDITNNIDYKIEDQTIKATVKDNYTLNGALTVDIVLPEGYFYNTKDNYKNISAFICIFSIFICILLYILWIYFCKNNPKIKDSSTSYPPDGLDVSQVGFILKNVENNKKLSVALIISLVSKGYVKIFDTGNNQYVVFNLTVKDNSSFRNSKNISIPSGLAVVDTSTLLPLSKNEKIIFDRLFEKDDINALYQDSELYTIFDVIGQQLKTKLAPKLKISRYKSIQFLSWFLTISSTMLMVLGYYGLQDIQPEYQFLSILGWGCAFASIIPSFFMNAKKLYGEKIIEKSNNFKNFIETSDVSQLKELQNQNPLYYYAILPYAYVLGINKNWIDKFKFDCIPQEVVYSMNTVDYFDYYMIDNISDNIRYPEKKTKSES